MRPGRQDQRLADLNGLRHRVMRMPGQDHVDPRDHAGELAVDVETVVRQKHHHLGAIVARGIHIGLQRFRPDAERPFREHPARIGDRRVGHRLADHRDRHTALLEHRRVFERRFVPLRVEDVGGQERISHLLDEFEEAVLAEGELPVARHRIGLEHLHAVDHVLAVRLERRVRSLPRVAAIEEQHPVVTALGPDRLDQRRRAVEPPETAIRAGEIDIVEEGVGIGQRTAALDPELLEKRFADQMRRDAGKVADADIGVGWPEIDRRELRVHVGEMQQRHLTLGVEAQQVVLRELLLCQRAGGVGKQSRRAERRPRIDGELEEISSRIAHPVILQNVARNLSGGRWPPDVVLFRPDPSTGGRPASPRKVPYRARSRRPRAPSTRRRRPPGIRRACRGCSRGSGYAATPCPPASGDRSESR